MRSRSLIWSFEYAIRGIVYSVRTQRNMRLHLVLAAGVFIAALWFGIRGLELIALILSIGFVIAAELLNTAIEATVDLATDGFDPLAAIAKDVAAGAVLISAITAVAVGYVVFFTRATTLAQALLTGARSSSSTITLLALALTSIAVLAIKAASHEKGTTFMRGGWPSGHTAIAFSMATAIGYSLSSAKAMVLALFVAALVGQSRAETGAHTVPQILSGALLGFLLTTAVFQIFWR
jgi:diacylglycerol kinase (ATP)